MHTTLIEFLFELLEYKKIVISNDKNDFSGNFY